jgi:inner membrane protein COX18
MNPVLKLNLAKKVQQAQAKLKTAEESKDFAAVQSLNTLASMKLDHILLLAAKEVRKRQKALFAKNDVQLWKNFILPAFQVPLWIIMSITMRNLSGWSSWDYTHNKALDPTLYTEGMLWFPDLTIADPMHIFPVVLGITALCNVEWTLKTLELLRLTKKLRFRPTLSDAVGNLTKLSIVFMMAISLHAPAALTIYWISSQVYSLFQNVIMDLVFPISFTPKTRFNYKKSKNEDAVNVIN